MAHASMAHAETGLRQPILGLAALAGVLVVAFAIMAAFSVAVFNTWVAFLIMTIIPCQIFCGLVWHCQKPAALAKLPQPAKGIAYLALCGAVGAVVGFASLYLIGGGITPPTPPLIMYVILSIVVTFWFAVVWGTWPFSRLPIDPVVSGFLGLIFCYLAAYGLFALLFDFSFLAGAPFYSGVIDPHGLFMAWKPLAFGVTSVAVIMFTVLFDFWPISSLKLKPRSPGFALAATLYILLLASLVFGGFVVVGGMDIVKYLVLAPVPFIFGFFIVVPLLHKYPFADLRQPLAGVSLAVAAAIAGLAMYVLYRYLAPLLTGGAIASGPPTYDLELWLASAMLAVTFPLIVFAADFLGLWPFKRGQASHG